MGGTSSSHGATSGPGGSSATNNGVNNGNSVVGAGGGFYQPPPPPQPQQPQHLQQSSGAGLTEVLQTLYRQQNHSGATPPAPSTYAASDVSQDSNLDGRPGDSVTGYHSDSTAAIPSRHRSGSSGREYGHPQLVHRSSISGGTVPPNIAPHPGGSVNNGRQSKESRITPPYTVHPDTHTPMTASEDKRRRNTAASARFRLKKKEREAALERKSKDLEVRVSELERECETLRRENGWLKGLVVGVTGVTGVSGPPATGGLGGLGNMGSAAPSPSGNGPDLMASPGSTTGKGTKRRRELSPGASPNSNPSPSSSPSVDPSGNAVRDAAEAAAVAVMGHLKETVAIGVQR